MFFSLKHEKKKKKECPPLHVHCRPLGWKAFAVLYLAASRVNEARRMMRPRVYTRMHEGAKAQECCSAGS